MQPLSHLGAQARADLGCLLLAGASHLLLIGLTIWAQAAASPDAGFWQSFSLWNRWDTPHYLDLARHGYSNHGDLGLFIVFFPGYPALIRILDLLVGDMLTSALLISYVALCAACLGLRRIAEHYLGPDAGLTSVWYLLIFPTAYFFHAAYTEALFMALLLWGWLALLRRDWFWVGLLGMGLSALRINGLLIGLVASWVIGRELYRDRRWQMSYLWCLLIPLGFLLYLAINQWLYSDPWHFLSVQAAHWHKTPGTPWGGIADLFHRLDYTKGREFWLLAVAELAAVGLAILACIYAFVRLSAASGIWCTSNLLLITSSGWLLSTPRYLLTLFPLYLLLAECARRGLIRRLLDLVCISLMTMLCWEFLHGRWAF